MLPVDENYSLRPRVNATLKPAQTPVFEMLCKESFWSGGSNIPKPGAAIRTSVADLLQAQSVYPSLAGIQMLRLHLAQVR
jgi:hypothetical protein